MQPTLSAGAAGELIRESVSLPALFVVAIVLSVAVYTELKENKIPNWLTFSGMAVGLLIGYIGGQAAFTSSLVGLAIGFGFLFLFYVFGGVGGGDVKLMGAAGALMGSDLTKPAVVYTAVLGAFMAVMLVVWRKDFLKKDCVFHFPCIHPVPG